MDLTVGADIAMRFEPQARIGELRMITPMENPPAISRPYAHGSMWRCRIKTKDGWRWCATADSPESAVLAAQKAAISVEPSPSFLNEGKKQAACHPEAAADKLAKERRSKKESGDSGFVRLDGPHRHRGRYRYRLVSSFGRKWAPSASTEREARQLAEKQAKIVAKQSTITIRDAINAHVEAKRNAGARPSTLVGTHRALTMYWNGALESQVSWINPHRAQQQYDKLRETIGARTGRTLSAATHQTYRGLAGTFARWAVSKGWLREDPLAEVKSVGKRRRGKLQLTLDEARRLSDTCVEEQSMGSTATLMCMLMALRVSEVVSRVARDLDNGGTLLRIDDNEAVAFLCKTDSSKRSVKIPAVLQPMLAQLQVDKMPDAPLFPGSLGGRKRRQWLHEEARRLCLKAGVPAVCPHALRGVMATAAAAAGELPEVVAKVLGHSSSKMTLRHYIVSGTSEAAQLERGNQNFDPKSPPLPC